MKTPSESDSLRHEKLCIRLALSVTDSLLDFENPDEWGTPLAEAQDWIHKLTFAIVQARSCINAMPYPTPKELAKARRILSMNLEFPFVD